MAGLRDAVTYTASPFKPTGPTVPTSRCAPRPQAIQADQPSPAIPAPAPSPSTAHRRPFQNSPTVHRTPVLALPTSPISPNPADTPGRFRLLVSADTDHTAPTCQGFPCLPRADTPSHPPLLPTTRAFPPAPANRAEPTVHTDPRLPRARPTCRPNSCRPARLDHPSQITPHRPTTPTRARP